MPKIGVNLLGEPGGVAFFENCRVRGLNTDKIISEVMMCLSQNDNVILYDHPYYAGTKELYTIRRIITEVQDKGVNIVTLRDLQ